jgi:hypothetical protein
MSIYNTGTRPNEIWPGLKGFWDGMSEELSPLYPQYFKEEKSTQKYEKYTEHYNTGLVQVKAEGDSTKFAGFAQGASPELRNVAYSLGIILTHESISDNLYFKEGNDKIRALRKSFFTSKEINGANILNNGFDSNYLMPNGDGVELFSSAHPNAAGTYANELAIPSDLSEQALEDMLVLIKKTYDASGVHKANLTARKLIIPDEQEFNAARILKSVLQNNTGNNAINAIKSLGKLPEGYLCNTYLTDEDSWFVTTDADNGLIYQNRESLSIEKDNEMSTKNLACYGYERYAFGWVNPRGIFGSEG